MEMYCLFLVCQLMCLRVFVMMPAPPSFSRNCYTGNCYFIHLFGFPPFLDYVLECNCELWWRCILIAFCKLVDRDVLPLTKKTVIYTPASKARHVSVSVIYL